MGRERQFDGKNQLLSYLMLAPIMHARKLLDTLDLLQRLITPTTTAEIVRRIEGAQMNAVRCLGAYASVAWDAERVMARAKGKAALLRLAPAVYVNVIDGKCYELPTRDLSSTKASDAWRLLASFEASVSFDSTAYLSLPAPSRPEKAMGRRSVTCFLFAHCLVVAGCVPSWYCSFDGERPPLDVLFIISFTSSVRTIKKGNADVSFRITSGKRWYRFYFEQEADARDIFRNLSGLLDDARASVAEEKQVGTRVGRPQSKHLGVGERFGVEGFFPGMSMIERRKLAGELKASREKWASPEARVSPSKVGKISGVSEPERLQFKDSLRTSISPASSLNMSAISLNSSLYGRKNCISFHSESSPAKKRSARKNVLPQERLGFGSTSATRRSGARAENVRHGYYMAEKDNTKVCDAAEEGRTVEERFDVDSPHRPGSRDSPVDVDMSIFKSPRPKGVLRRADSADSTPPDLPSQRRYIGLKWAQSEYVKQRHRVEAERAKKPGMPSRRSNMDILR